jgi:TPR repeat protein
MKPSHIAAFAIWAVLATPIGAQDFGAGVAAYEAGDFATALENWQPFAEQGNARGQYNLGVMYANGRGVPQDYAEAMRWYRLAAEQGDAVAQGLLGSYYVTGQGVPQDDILAHMWFNIASAGGDAQSAGIRDALAESMTREQTADAQVRARVCMSSGYQDCE